MSSGLAKTERAKKISGELNEVQAQAANHPGGPVVVFAGAGSGKTRIITSRIALLIESGIRPDQILAVTFTNKAAGEMKERVENLTPYAAKVMIGTFHSTCARWLREFAPELGFTSDFTIFDEKDALAAVKAVLKELRVKSEEDASPSDYRSAIARAKTYGWFPKEAEKMAHEHSYLFPPMGAQVYKRYQEFLAACNAMDFSDLLLNMLLLLKNNAGVRSILQRRYLHLLVDEYQDTNQAQFELISYLVGTDRNLFVVGDDDQSIYSWRGANPNNILDFERHYPGATRIHLEQNYRCTGNIVEAASAMIAHNTVRAEKTLWTDNDPGDLIDFHLEYDGEMEAWAVVDKINAERSHFSLMDIAIFYRTNAQSRQMEEALRRDNIPYRIYGAVRFYDRAEIKDLLSYIRICLNPGDDVAFKRVVNVPGRGIGDKAQDKVAEIARERGLSFYETAKKLVEENVPRLAVKLKVFVSLVEKMREQIKKADLEDVIAIILEMTSYKEYLDKKFPEQAGDKIANIHELGSAIADFSAKNADAGLSQWMQEISLSGSEEESEGGVSLMTLHSAKGLEFKRVFMIGVEDGLMPHSNSLQDTGDLEEERRLFYVGITRAREKLSLFAAQKRRVYNNWMANPPSRFLKEIPSKLFSTSIAPTPSYEQSTEAYYDYGDEEEAEIYIGATVFHPTYGKGVVEEVSDDFGVSKAVVDFHDHGKRKIRVSHLS